MTKISLQSRRELVSNIREKYKQSGWKEKCKILDGFIAATGYQRKYAINLINFSENNGLKKTAFNTNKGKSKYGLEIKNLLLIIWHAANEICAKRLVPFIPDLVSALERHGHLSMSASVRKQILSVSAATVDRILKPERVNLCGKGISATRSGSLLKKQIKVRTFADWNEINPGFLEGDLVAHCGDKIGGSFLNTLVLTDIASTWTEFLPLLCKSSDNVVFGVNIIKKLLPFTLLGIDTDNGSEFINYELLNFCKENNITFTRSRAYRKNDQAHVEEKNGSIIRRLVGYDRYEGFEAWRALVDLYAVLRLYVNYFQPSMKLISKKRDGAKVTKKYDKAQTPYKRLLNSNISHEAKAKMQEEYESLDPVNLLDRLKKCQDLFWRYAWSKENCSIENKLMNVSVRKNEDQNNFIKNGIICNSSEVDKNIEFKDLKNVTTQTITEKEKYISNRKYRYSKKIRKQMVPRTWRTRKDPFENVWDGLCLQLEINPHKNAKTMLDDLVAQHPEKFNYKSLRTLQRRVVDWRKQQQFAMKKQHAVFSLQKDIGDKYLSLVMQY